MAQNPNAPRQKSFAVHDSGGIIPKMIAPTAAKMCATIAPQNADCTRAERLRNR